jgi:hypothetical protein
MSAPLISRGISSNLAGGALLKTEKNNVNLRDATFLLSGVLACETRTRKRPPGEPDGRMGPELRTADQGIIRTSPRAAGTAAMADMIPERAARFMGDW